ncbi:GyrI-like domain-containing protein [Sphingobacterium faecale]|uniref:AraC family transcriptional regulator n=1 Tax=Sphingobacterium faecale TaxID=2803775 RepID=A0ABS1R0U6_9SPHI|nr:GyrI-like domain-containing protein [Sphingobacterium faecale]MBL1407935.1 AraC family transcriptional regulator [Sphingobacterium faecale]
MEFLQVDPFELIGISILTSNDPGKADVDIPALWQRFFAEDILNKIPNKVDHVIYSVYTDYEGDHTQPYRVVLGCRVASIDYIPDGMLAHRINGGKFKKFTAKGNMKENIVYNEWLHIWNTDLDRTFQSDFEQYDERSQNMNNAEVDIFIGIK